MQKTKRIKIDYTFYVRLRSNDSTVHLNCLSAKTIQSAIQEQLTFVLRLGRTNIVEINNFQSLIATDNYCISQNCLCIQNKTESVDICKGDILIIAGINIDMQDKREVVERALLEYRYISLSFDTTENQTVHLEAFPDDRVFEFFANSKNNLPVMLCKNSTFPELPTMSPQIISPMMTCKQVQLEDNEFQIAEKFTISVPVLGLRLSISKYTIIGSSARVCVSDYFHAVNEGDVDGKTPSHILEYLSTVSLVGTSLSVFCLFLAIITYCIFPSFRTLPGKLNLILSITLLLCIASFELAYYRLLSGSPCTIIGIVLHYSWIALFSCLNVCSFHMHRVFTSSTYSRHSASIQKRTFLTYMLYILGFPFLVVVTNLSVNLALSEGELYGYEGPFCFLMPPFSFYVFILPTTTILFINIVYFARTIYFIRRSPVVPGSEQSRPQLFTLVKLFTLTGTTWLLQVVDTTIEFSEMTHSIFSLIVTILSAFQGFFIFVAFVCNARVLQAYKTIFSKPPQNQNHELQHTPRVNEAYNT